MDSGGEWNQLCLEDECERLYGPQLGPARVGTTKLKQQILGSRFGHNSGTSLGFAALSLRLTGKPSSLSYVPSSIPRGKR